MSAELSAIRTVGAMLPADLLGRVAAGDPDLGGLKSADYHLAGETPREAANRAWAYLTGVWPTFRDALATLPDGDPAVGLTRERWLLVLFRELDYGRLQSTSPGGITADGKAYPVSHQWSRVPIHLLGWGVDLDKRTKGVPGAADRAPHAMVQELLNRSDHHLWAMVSNGRSLRLLRDSTSLSTQSYVEFDLDSIFSGELFADFVVLYLLLHQSRLEVPSDEASPTECWLEKWRSSAIVSGTRALALLSDGVQKAIEDLGTGFLRAPGNTALRQQIEDKTLSLSDFHQALLRLVYRLLFLFVAEDRQALHPEDSDSAARARYRDFYSTTHLRRLALRRRGTRHTDLWEALRLVIAHLGQDDGCAELALPGLGGLFDDQGAEVLADTALPNDALLSAIRDLSIVQPPGQPQRSVDYKNLGAEELGGIYESLLELVPRHNSVEQTLTLENLAGNDRKTTGSYYTPTSLIDLVLDETLTPLLDEAARADDPEIALLAMTVCDPACGSGHFLVAAARRIAERLAIVRTGEADPTPSHLQSAIYDVVNLCIYGVDLNPMAAELAKVSLWLESMQPGRALSFLDAHIKVGNALLGTTPALLDTGMPDGAFIALAGDDKAITTGLKKRNKAEREAGADSLFSIGEVGVSNIDLRKQLAAARITAPAEQAVTNLRDVHATKQAYADYLASPELMRERLQANAWCAAFVQRKVPGAPSITTATLIAIQDGTASDETIRMVQHLAVQYRFFHWYLEFPEVFEASAATASEMNGWRGGFTTMLGNPPWERIKLQEQEFFAQRDAEVAGAPNAAARKILIKALRETSPALAAEWEAAGREAEGTSHYLRKSGRYPLCGVGDVNTYSVFAELFRSSIAGAGRMGIITPTGLATDATTSAFFADTVAHRRLVAFYDFENEAKVFEGVHNQFRFAVSSITGGSRVDDVRLAFYTRHVAETASRRFAVTADEVLLLNPNTGTLPVFRTRLDAEITLGIYRRHPVLMNDSKGTNPWGLRFTRLLDMANDSGLFETQDDLRDLGAKFNGWAWTSGSQRWLPLYEAKMLSHFDHRYSTYEDATQAQLNKGTLPRLAPGQHDDAEKEPLARYWVAEEDVESAIGDRWDRDWFLGWRDIARASDARTFVSSVLPRSAVGHKFPLAWGLDRRNAAALQAMWSSYSFDYVARQKLSGAGMTYFIVKQFAAPAPAQFEEPLTGITAEPLGTWIGSRVVELTFTSTRLAPYAIDVLGLPEGGDPGAPFHWIPERREILRAELDAAIFHLYGLTHAEVDHVMDSFFVVRKYEERDHGEFRTKRLILEAYDAMADAAARGTTYNSPLDPPPGQGPRHPGVAPFHRDAGIRSPGTVPNDH